MIDVFDMYMNENHVAVWYYDKEKDKLFAKLDSHFKAGDFFPYHLFGRPEHLGNKKILVHPIYEVDDTKIRDYISAYVAPRNRENIDEILKVLGLKYYDQWEIWRACEGRNPCDHTRLIYRETVEKI